MAEVVQPAYGLEGQTDSGYIGVDDQYQNYADDALKPYPFDEDQLVDEGNYPEPSPVKPVYGELGDKAKSDYDPENQRTKSASEKNDDKNVIPPRLGTSRDFGATRDSVSDYSDKELGVVEAGDEAKDKNDEKSSSEPRKATAPKPPAPPKSNE